MAKIVIVDDDEVTTGVVMSCLEDDGHVVVPVHHGDEAVAAILGHDADLVILDQALPGKSGMHILAELRKLPSAIDLPIMMLTNRGSRLHIELADKGGADDYVTKPFDTDDLCARVRGLLVGATISRSARKEEGADIGSVGSADVGRS